MIRALLAKDILVLLKSREEFSDGWNKDMLLSAFNSGRFIGYVEEENGEVLGYLTASLTIGEGDIESVFTFPKHRKKGIAFSLINKFLSEHSNLDKIFLEVRKSNIPAINAYKKAGFKEISERKKYYADGEDALIFVKEN